MNHRSSVVISYDIYIFLLVSCVYHYMDVAFVCFGGSLFVLNECETRDYKKTSRLLQGFYGLNNAKESTAYKLDLIKKL